MPNRPKRSKPRTSNPSRPTKAAEPAAETRSTERLLALFRYELGHENGINSSELLEEILEWVGDVLMNSEDDATYNKPTEADFQRWDKQNTILAEHIVLALVASGHAAECSRFIERCAERRRECEAKFNQDRLIPFAHGERESLAAAWNASAASEGPSTEQVLQ